MQEKKSGSLWEDALAAYARPGVATRCLDLQERCGADIDLLLTAAWLARRGLCWCADDIAALQSLCAPWRERCLLPLRVLRRYAREHAGDGPLYARLKEAELEAERHQLALIEVWLQASPPVPATIDPLRHNLHCYFDCLELDRLGADAAAEAESLARLLQ